MRFTYATLLVMSLFCSGCSICPPGFLDDYATIGGKWQRSDPAQGRVGSIFSDPGSSLMHHGATDRAPHSAEVYDQDYPVHSYLSEDGTSSGHEYYDYHDDNVEGNFVDSYDYDDGVILLGEQW